MEVQKIFKRYELKFIMNDEQRNKLLEIMKKYMKEDEYGESTIRSIYFDTDSFRIIRKTLEKPAYREKLRIRSYTKANSESDVFVELKKKYKSVVYKRRVIMKEKDAMNYLCNGNVSPIKNQITDEIDYFKSYYENLRPSVMISYDRVAFYGIDDRDLRITFDKNIMWRDFDLSLCSDVYGRKILDDNKTLMEVKTTGAMPMWLVEFLSFEKIYKCRFSKYKNAYYDMCEKNEKMKVS
ncbi:polyphosphate polymerase domain-containing protein [Peptacetobacter hominis]|uniref:Polyphosphate polymerase domain-containing protein n=1 Tax=Peptacetobacter hominis TaxID=2743610 RepID=A0A544QW93_9FIRM|nr:polyphosphate polymerase domain-containing protein [Peptacetobacter hominis]TQQ84958.1 polyphosphate polymerase domain-containing protein [Peptacetobacter hominis]